MFERFRLFKPQTTELKVDDLPAFLTDKFRQDRSETESKLRPTVQEIRINFSLLKNAALNLKAKESSNRYSNILKDKFCDKAIESVDKAVMNADNYESMKESVRVAADMIRTISGMGIKEFKHLHAFRDDMSKIAEKIRQIEAGIEASNKTLQNSPVSRSDAIKKDAEMLINLSKKTKVVYGEILELESKLESINNAILFENKKTTELNTELNKYASERLQVKELEKTMENIKQQIAKEFSGMDRVMKKFVYFGDLSKDETAILKDYSEDPAETFLDKDGNNLLRKILDAMHDYKDKKMIDMDDRKSERLKDIIRQFDFLTELRSHYKNTKQKKDETEDQLNKEFEPIKQSLRLSASEINSREKELASIRAKIDNKNVEKKTLEKDALAQRNKIEISLSQLLGNQVRLV